MVGLFIKQETGELLSDLHSEVYDYIRGAVLILSLYHLFIFAQNKNKQFLYYSLYFLFIFLFFLGQGIDPSPIRNFYILATPSIHLLSYIFYISFARELLRTKDRLAYWDKYLVIVRSILLFFLPVFILTTMFLGHSYQKNLFFIVSPMFTIFALISYVKFYSLKDKVTKYFILGSLLFLVFTNVTFLGQVFYGIKGFAEVFKVHPTFFMYIGTLLEAILFATLLGFMVKKLEEEKMESQDELSNLKRIVFKDYITLKDKTKIYLSDLIYIKSDDHYLNVFTANGSNHFVRGKLSQIIKELPPNFKQCHRSYIVNSNFIKQKSYNSITLTGRESLPISKSFKKDF